MPNATEQDRGFLNWKNAITRHDALVVGVLKIAPMRVAAAEQAKLASPKKSDVGKQYSYQKINRKITQKTKGRKNN
jgi:hypothetical protein